MSYSFLKNASFRIHWRCGWKFEARHFLGRCRWQPTNQHNATRFWIHVRALKPSLPHRGSGEKSSHSSRICWRHICRKLDYDYGGWMAIIYAALAESPWKLHWNKHWNNIQKTHIYGSMRENSINNCLHVIQNGNAYPFPEERPLKINRREMQRAWLRVNRQTIPAQTTIKILFEFMHEAVSAGVTKCVEGRAGGGARAYDFVLCKIWISSGGSCVFIPNIRKTKYFPYCSRSYSSCSAVHHGSDISNMFWRKREKRVHPHFAVGHQLCMCGNYPHTMWYVQLPNRECEEQCSLCSFWEAVHCCVCACSVGPQHPPSPVPCGYIAAIIP